MAHTIITELAPDADVWTMRLSSEQFEATAEKIEKLNERAARKGLAGTVGIAYRTVEETEENALGFEVTKVYYETAITGDAPKFNGWRFIATLDFDENAGLVVRTFPGVESVDREELRAGWCGHCKTTRRRTRSFLVRNDETGEQVQVGSSCIKDFTGWAGNVAWLETSKVRETVGEGGGVDFAPEYSPESVLAVAWACVKAFGYRRAGEDGSTGSMVYTVLYPHPKSSKDKAFAEKMRPLAKEAKERGADILAFLLSDDFAGNSEYVRNLKNVAAGKRVSRRYVGLLASAPQAWARHNEQTLIRKARAEKPSEWIGTAPDKDKGIKGDRITFTGVIETIRFIYGDYGTTTLYQLRDELSGALVKWFASSSALGDVEGNRVTIKGTVKAHDEYQGLKSTVLTRCTLLADMVEEPAPFIIGAPAKARTPRKKAAAPAPAPVVEEAPQAPAPAVVEAPAPVVAEEAQEAPQAAEEAPLVEEHDHTHVTGAQWRSDEEASTIARAAIDSTASAYVYELRRDLGRSQEPREVTPDYAADVVAVRTQLRDTLVSYDGTGYVCIVKPEGDVVTLTPVRREPETVTAPPQETAPDSARETEANILEMYAGGTAQFIADIAENAEEESRFRAALERKRVWVTLGNYAPEPLTLSGAYDLLGEAYADGAQWAADLMPASGAVAAVRWDGQPVVITDRVPVG
jgi:hypothetical protein